MSLTIPFFSQPNALDALKAECESWKGTRFHPRAGGRALKGASCDCVSFVEAVMVELKAMRPIEWPPYVIRGGGPQMLDLLLSILDAIPDFWVIHSSDPAPGDILVCSANKDRHHLAIYVGDKTVWHSIFGYGVCTGNIDDPLFQKDLVAIYRPMFPR